MRLQSRRCLRIEDIYKCDKDACLLIFSATREYGNIYGQPSNVALYESAMLNYDREDK